MKKADRPLVIGLISDTHGLLRPEALQALRGSDFIIHAGDIGDPAILPVLADIAPLTAVRGNNDADERFAAVPEHAWLEAGGVRILVLHDFKRFDAKRDLGAGGRAADFVVSGHSHKPVDELRGGVRHVNPGSAGPRRFKLPVSVGQLVVASGTAEVRLIELSLRA